ncbi:MAG: rhomboid family intramembrane serine protease [Verrucomicrobiales bacterium]|nr:rhomboid family intramembrane serine protease [Verrucomicrobiales bacterium]
MREPSYGQGLSASAKLMIALGVIFVFQAIDQAYIRSGVQGWLALWPADVLGRGFIWQLVTFQLLHGGPIHLLFNLLGVWFFGRAVESIHGPVRMLQLFFLSGIAGGLLQILVSLIIPGWSSPVVGASAGTMGFLAAFCLLEPSGTVILYFVPVQARIVLYISLGLSLFLTLVPIDAGMAHPAHLGGLLAGMAIIRYGYPNLSWLSGWFSRKNEPRRSSGSSRTSGWALEKVDPPVSRSATPSGQDFISKEIDPILDKISTHGFQSLTADERKTLEAARHRMKS